MLNTRSGIGEKPPSYICYVYVHLIPARSAKAQSTGDWENLGAVAGLGSIKSSIFLPAMAGRPSILIMMGDGGGSKEEGGPPAPPWAW